MTLTQQGHISNRVMTQTLFQPAKLRKMIVILNGIHILSTKILESVTMQHLDYLVQEAIKLNCVFIKTENANKLCFKSNQQCRSSSYDRKMMSRQEKKGLNYRSSSNYFRNVPVLTSGILGCKRVTHTSFQFPTPHQSDTRKEMLPW